MECCNAPYGACDCFEEYMPPRVTLRDVGPTGFSIVGNGLGPNLTVKTLVPGTGVTMSYDPAGSITIGFDDEYSNITLNGTGMGPTGLNANLVIEDEGPDLVIKNLNEGTGIKFLDNANGPVTIYQDPLYSNVTLRPVGNGFSLVDGIQTGPDLEIRSLFPGGIVTIGSLGGGTLLIDVPDYEPAVDFTIGTTAINNGSTMLMTSGPPNPPTFSWGSQISGGININAAGTYLFVVNAQTAPNVQTFEFALSPSNAGVVGGSRIAMDFGTQNGFGGASLDPVDSRSLTLMVKYPGGTNIYFWYGILTSDGNPGNITVSTISVKRLY